MTTQERREMDELDHGTATTAVIQGEAKADRSEYASEWVKLPADEKKQIRGNRNFIEDGDGGHPPFVIVIGGRTWAPINAHGVRFTGEAQMKSVGIPAKCGKSSVWLEVTGEVEYLPNPPQQEVV